MATRPRLTRTEVDAAVERITKRHRKVEDPYLDRLGTDPRDVHDYLHKYRGAHLPSWVRQADVPDDLMLQVWLWWEDQRRLYNALRTGRRLGLFLTQLGGPLGIKSPQGVQDLLDRLTALLKYDRPDEKLTREERHLQAADSAYRDARILWIELHKDRLHSLTTRLLAEADRYGVTDREWLDELEHDHLRDAFTPGSMGVLGLALSEVRTARGVVELRTTHNVHRVLAAGDQLRVSYARIAVTSGDTADPKESA